MIKKVLSKKNIIIIFMFMILASVYLMIFSTTTSPIYHLYGVDSEIFRMLGRMQKRGMIPYVDFFDHKGPFIITVEWIGCLISEDRIGIFIVQIIFLMFTLMATYKLFRLKYSTKCSFILTAVMLLVLRMYYEGGNLTEEYCLPFLIWSCYLASKYMMQYYDKIGEHKWQYSFFYGITFIICAFTRLTNAFPICSIVLVGSVIIISKKMWKNLLENTLAFLGGVSIVAIPYSIYFYVNNGFYDMIYATFIYNFKHGSDYSERVSMGEQIKIMVYLLVLITTMIIGIYTYLKKQNMQTIGLTVAIMSVVGIIFHLKMRFYLHYYMIYIPIIIMAILCCKGYFASHEKNILLKLFKMVATTLIVMTMIFFGVKNITMFNDFVLISESEASIKQSSERMKSLVKAIDTDSDIVAYDVAPYFYIETGIIPCYKNFIIQDQQTRYDKRLKSGFERDLKSMKAEYIVVSTNQNNRYQQFIEQKYYVYNRVQELVLYKRKSLD